METGRRGNYFWIEDGRSSIADLKSKVPEVILGKYLIVTAIDDQPPYFAHRDWFLHDDIAINPSVKSIADVPTGDRDEWYVFIRAPLLEPFEVFITAPQFSLKGDAARTVLDEKGQQNVNPNNIDEVRRRFWDQLELKTVETYAGFGEQLLVATRNENIYEKLIMRLCNS
jgi:hypothetical protein